VQQLVLGTAQWGDSYGITNQQGRLSDQSIEEIADLALNVGISSVDTAAGYGDAEVRLAPWAKAFNVTTKIQGASPISVAEQINMSLKNLEVEKLDGVLVHDWPSLTQDEARTAVHGLLESQQRELTGSIGVSAYDEKDLSRAIDYFGTVQAIQLPFNILDRRLLGTDVMNELASQGCDIQVRSIFLQGLLASQSDSPLGNHADVLAFHEACASQNFNPLVTALAFVQSQSWVKKIVVGVTTADELQQIHTAWDANTTNQANSMDLDAIFESFQESQDLSLLDPRKWTKGQS